MTSNSEPSSAKTTLRDALGRMVKALSRSEKYSLASRIISEISAEWNDAPDSDVWQSEHVEAYESSISFDELAAEVRSVEFKASSDKTASRAQPDAKFRASAESPD